MSKQIILTGCALALLAGPVLAAEELANLDTQVQDIKAEALALNRDLFILEEELLFPANTQVAVFLSLDVGDYFSLDSVELKLNGKDVTNYLYTEREVDALKRGAVQRLYLDNLRAGEHEIVAVFTGKGPEGRDYRRGATKKFDKEIGALYLELQIHDQKKSQQPDFSIKEWN